MSDLSDSAVPSTGDRAQSKRWLATLRAQDPLTRQNLLYRGLRQMNRLPLTAMNRLPLLERCAPLATETLEILAAQHHAQPILSAERTRSAFDLHQQLLFELSFSWTAVATHQGAGQLPPSARRAAARRALALYAARALQYRLHYRPSPSCWSDVHTLQRLLLPRERHTAAADYVNALVWLLIDTYSLAAGQHLQLQKALQTWTQGLPLQPPSTEATNTHGHYRIDLDSENQPVGACWFRGPLRASVRDLSMLPLAAMAQEALRELPPINLSERSAGGLQHRTLRALLAFCGARTGRCEGRHASGDALEVIVGLADIHANLQHPDSSIQQNPLPWFAYSRSEHGIGLQQHIQNAAKCRVGELIGLHFKDAPQTCQLAIIRWQRDAGEEVHCGAEIIAENATAAIANKDGAALEREVLIRPGAHPQFFAPNGAFHLGDRVHLRTNTQPTQTQTIQLNEKLDLEGQVVAFHFENL